MNARCGWIPLGALFLFLAAMPGRGQDTPPLPPTPEGVEVQARGPVHEAFAGPTSEAVATPAVPKKPPAAIDEIPPAEKPAGDMIWIGGYWGYDDDRKDFLWVSGTWRAAPPGKQWVAGYWREQGTDWQWVPGFWATASKQDDKQDVTYLPVPPAAPQMAIPVKPPSEDVFYVPGTWIWNGSTYAWRNPHWARIQPGYVWVPDHYRWTPSGYIHIVGYWDLPIKSRGILYAPVVIDPSVVTVGFTYTPAYAVRDTIVVDAMFIRPTTCHYYFGDYYGPSYRTLGYESCVVYSSRNYDSIIVYERYERRRDPTWFTLQVNVYNDRYEGRAVCPPRTLIQQQQINNTTIVNNTTINNTTVNNINMIAPPAQVAAAKSTTMVKLDDATRQQARVQAATVQQVAQQRVANEKPLAPGAPRQARVASLSVPKAQAVKPGMVAARPTASAASVAKPTTTTPAMRPAVASTPARTVSNPPARTVSNPMPPRSPGIQPVSARVPVQTPVPTGTRPGMTPTLPNGRPNPLIPQKKPLPKRPPDKKD